MRILLFGMPRSGTTWLGKTFDSHPQTLYLHEPDSRDSLLDIPIVPDQLGYDEFANRAKNYVEALSTMRSIAVLGKLPLFNKEYYPPGYGLYLRSWILLGKALGKFGIACSLPDPFSVRRERSRVLVWKSIESLARLPLFMSATAGDVWGIHILRHPGGYIDSVLRGERSGRFSSAVPASEDYGFFELLLASEVNARYQLSMETIKHMSPVSRLAWRWVFVNEKAWSELKDHARYEIARYETLAMDPISGFKELFAAIGLPWAAETEAFLGRSTGTDDKNYYSVVRDSARAANSWRDSLARKDQADIEDVIRRSELCGVLGVA